MALSYQPMKRDAKREPQDNVFSSARQLPVQAALWMLQKRPRFYSS